MVTETENITPLSAQMEPIVPAGGGSTIDNPFSGQFDYYVVIFLLLLTAMQIRQTTVLTEAKQIAENASIQNKLNAQNAAIKFSILPPSAKTRTINEIQDENERYEQRRADIQDMIATAQFEGKQMMTQASTNVNILQQNASEDSGWLQTLNTVFQVIDEMSPN